MSNNDLNNRDSVSAIARNRDDAIKIAEGLRSAGFRDSDISFVMTGNDGKGAERVVVEENTKAPEGASTGAGAGLLLGGALGWAAGIGALAIPGLGPFIAAGPIMAALSGAALGTATGGVTGGLIGLGFSEHEAKEYEGHLREGKAFVSVHVDSAEEAIRARDVLTRAGAEKVVVKNVNGVRQGL